MSSIGQLCPEASNYNSSLSPICLPRRARRGNILYKTFILVHSVSYKSSKILNPKTRKIVHHDRNSHITSNIFHCYTVISKEENVMGGKVNQKKGSSF